MIRVCGGGEGKAASLITPRSGLGVQAVLPLLGMPERAHIKMIHQI